jgi:hypothetical protein
VNFRPKKIWLGYTLLACHLLLVLLIQQNSSAQAATSADDPVRVRTAWSVDRARPGEEAALAIIVDIKDGFHINADASQVRPFVDFKPYPTRVQVMAATEGITIETARFPPAKPIKVNYSSGALMSFEGLAIIYLPMKLDEQLMPEPVGLELKVEYQAGVVCQSFLRSDGITCRGG